MNPGTENNPSCNPADAAGGLATFRVSGPTGDGDVSARPSSRDLLTPAVQRVIEWHRQRASAN